jgi:phage tail tape-measure protein
VSAAFTRLTQNPAISMAELSRAATATKARIAELRAELQGTMPASSFLMTGAGKLVAMASAVVSLNAALALTRSILSTAGQFETLRTQLNAVEKSATKGGDAFAYIKQQAVNTPFQVTNLTQTYIRLRNYGLDPTAGSMQAIIDQAAKLGVPGNAGAHHPGTGPGVDQAEAAGRRDHAAQRGRCPGVGSAVQGHEQVSGRADEDVRKRPAGP